MGFKYKVAEFVLNNRGRVHAYLDDNKLMGSEGLTIWHTLNDGTVTDHYFIPINKLKENVWLNLTEEEENRATGKIEGQIKPSVYSLTIARDNIDSSIEFSRLQISFDYFTNSWQVKVLRTVKRV